MGNASNHGVKKDCAIDAGNPQQYRLIELFTLMTVVALASAMAAPYLRGLQSGFRDRLLMLAVLQFLGIVGAVVYLARKRKLLLDQAGQRIGVAFCGQIRWKHWPVVASVIFILLPVSAQLFFAIIFTHDFLRSNTPVFYYLFYIQYSCSLGYAISVYRWKSNPNSIEFFENGISQAGTKFISWEQVDVRPSSVCSDKIVVITRATPGSIAGVTTMAQVSDELREQVFAAAEAAKGSKACLA